MISIAAYDPTQFSMLKAWKIEFREFLKDFYKPYLVDAENIFSAISAADRFIKNHTKLETKLLCIKDVCKVQELKSLMLSHQSYSMGRYTSPEDKKVIVLDRYIDFLHHKTDAISPQQPIADTDNTSEVAQIVEGFLSEQSFFHRERNRSIRNKCAVRDNYTCQVCGFNFEQHYGTRGKNFIEVHHLKPISLYNDEHEIPLDDLISLCSNCHSMIHYGGDLISPKDLKALLSLRQQ